MFAQPIGHKSSKQLLDFIFPLVFDRFFLFWLLSGLLRLESSLDAVCK